MIVDRICDPNKAGAAASFRVDLVDSLLDLPRHNFSPSSEERDPKQRAQDLHALLTAFANWEALEEELLGLIEEAVGPDLDANLHELLQGSGLETIWRSRITEQMRRYTDELFGQQGFADWLTLLCEETSP